MEAEPPLAGAEEPGGARKRPREEAGAPDGGPQSPRMLVQVLSRVIMMAGTQVLQASVVHGGDQEHDPLWLVRPAPRP